MPRVVHIGLTNDGERFAIRTPFSKEFVEELKTLVPYRSRTWDGQNKAWMVHKDFYMQVEGLFRKYFGDDVDILGSKPAQAVIITKMIDDLKDPTMEDYQVLGVRPEASPMVIHGAFSVLEMYFATTYYLGYVGGDREDAHLESVPAWVKNMVKGIFKRQPLYAATAGGQSDKGISFDKTRSRLAYLRICKHRCLDPIEPPMVEEQFKKPAQTPAEVLTLMVESFKATAQV
jgi:hypothetical protein